MNPPQNLRELINIFIGLINPLLVILTGMSLVVFFWGLVVFIYKSGDAKSHTEGRNLMVWGLIALFVMVSCLGIIQFFYWDLGFRRDINIGGFLPQ